MHKVVSSIFLRYFTNFLIPSSIVYHDFFLYSVIQIVVVYVKLEIIISVIYDEEGEEEDSKYQMEARKD